LIGDPCVYRGTISICAIEYKKQIKLCVITAAHNLYIINAKTDECELVDTLEIFIDYKSENDYGLKFIVDLNPINILVHPDYIKYKLSYKDLALIELSNI
jgi:hypothetical protein